MPVNIGVAGRLRRVHDAQLAPSCSVIACGRSLRLTDAQEAFIVVHKYRAAFFQAPLERLLVLVVGARAATSSLHRGARFTAHGYWGRDMV